MTKIIFALILIFSAGCARSTYPASGFLDDYYRLQPGNIFEQEYSSPDKDFSKYTRLQIKPLITRYLANAHFFRKEELREMDRVYQQKFIEIYEGQFQFISPRGRANKETLIVEAALTLLEPPNRIVNVLAPVSRGQTAFEVRLIDGRTKNVIFEASEKSKGSPRKTSLVRGAYSKFSDSEESIAYWVQKLSWLIEAP